MENMYWQCELAQPADRLSNIRRMKYLTDCSFHVGDAVFPAHRIILSMSSPVFEAMFSNNWSEKDPKKPILVSDISASVFSHILDYIYTDEFEVQSIYEAQQVMYAAKKYLLPFLEKRLLKFVESKLSDGNACEAYYFAKCFDAAGLLNAAMNLIKKETSVVLQLCNYRMLHIETLLDILDCETFDLCSEIDLFSAIQKYAESRGFLKSDKEKDDSPRSEPPNEVYAPHGEMDENYVEELNIQKALQKVRFLTMSAETFARGPGMSGLLLSHECYSIFMNLIVPWTDIPLPDGFSYDKTQRDILNNARDRVLFK